MGVKLISGYIRAQLAQHLGPHVLEATLIKVTSGTRTPGEQSGGTNPTDESFACNGWVKSFESSQIDGTLVKTEDRMIALLGGTIAEDQVPEAGDKITIEGVTYRIVGGSDGKGVTRDADAAVYRCHGRGA